MRVTVQPPTPETVRRGRAVLALRRLDTMLEQAMRESVFTDQQVDAENRLGAAYTDEIRAIRNRIENHIANLKAQS